MKVSFPLALSCISTCPAQGALWKDSRTTFLVEILTCKLGYREPRTSCQHQFRLERQRLVQDSSTDKTATQCLLWKAKLVDLEECWLWLTQYFIQFLFSSHFPSLKLGYMLRRFMVAILFRDHFDPLSSMQLLNTRLWLQPIFYIVIFKPVKNAISVDCPIWVCKNKLYLFYCFWLAKYKV